MISYDPQVGPKAPPEMIEEFLDGTKSFAIVCVLDADGKVEDGVSFLLSTPFLPRVGETLHLEDGTIVEVNAVNYMVKTLLGRIYSFPRIIALKTEE